MSKKIIGRVVDFSNAPLPGATVELIDPVNLKPIGIGTVTNSTGYYELTIPDSQIDKARVSFSFVGKVPFDYSQKSVPAEVQLPSKDSVLETVVVTAKKRGIIYPIVAVLGIVLLAKFMTK